MASNEYLELYNQVVQDKINIDGANEDAEAQGVIIIDPLFSNYSSENSLDDRWELYNSMTKPFKRRADWITIERFGMTNQTIYELMKALMLAKEVDRYDIDLDTIGSSDDAIYESASDETSTETEFERISNVLDSFTGEDLTRANAEAIRFMKDTNIFMLCPAIEINSIEELDSYDERLGLLPHPQERKSNRKMLELYGITNLDYYKYMYHILSRFDTEKSSYDKIPIIGENSNRHLLDYARSYLDTIIESEDSTPNDIAECITNIIDIPGSYESIIAGDIISDAIDKYDGLTANVATMNLDVSDLPMYTPDEMIDMDVFSGEEIDAEDISYFPSGENEEFSPRKWFSEYYDYYYSGMCTESFLQENIKRVRALDAWSKGIKNIDPFKYGWNPYIEFNPTNRVTADNRIRSILSEKMNTSTFIDLRGFETDNIPEIKLEADLSKDGLKPIFIALEEGKRPIFSDLIRTVSKGIFSHAMISFDSSMETLYSYGVDTKVKTLGSFIIENIKNKPKGAIIKIYTIFVNNTVYDTIKKNVEWFVVNQKKTNYAWLKLFAYLFNIPTKSNTDLICSEFVDKMLKLGGIDITKGVNSNLVSPNDIDRAAKKNRKIYTVFNGKIGNFSKNKIDKIVARVSSKAKSFTEANLYEFAKNNASFNTCTRLAVRNIDVLTELSRLRDVPSNRDDRVMTLLYSRLLMPCLEAREIPVKITSHGDLIIRNLAPVDFEAAYSKSHKLLVEYAKAENIEGMKKELAYLWYLNIILEKRIHTPTVKEEKKKNFEKARAKILNDFKTYIKVVQDHDKNFDFRQYFEDSDYSDAAYKISGPTIKATFDLIKKLI